MPEHRWRQRGSASRMPRVIERERQTGRQTDRQRQRDQARANMKGPKGGPGHRSSPRRVGEEERDG